MFEMATILPMEDRMKALMIADEIGQFHWSISLVNAQVCSFDFEFTSHESRHFNLMACDRRK